MRNGNGMETGKSKVKEKGTLTQSIKSIKIALDESDFDKPYLQKGTY